MGTYLFLFAVLLFSNTGSDDGTHYNFHRFLHDKGLPGENVRSVFQDSHGFIWFSIDSEGLCSYDGAELEVFGHIGRDTTTISSNYINDIHEDINGNIWLATDKGLNIFDRKKRSFHKIDLPQKGLDLCKVIYRDRQGTMWLGTDKGLLEFAGKSNEPYYIKHQDMITERLAGLSINCIYEEANGSYWVGTDSGLYHFSHTNKQATHWNDTSGGFSLSDNEISSILQLSKGFFLIGTDNGVNLFDRERNRFHRLEFRESGVFNQAKVGIVDVFQDSKGIVWIGTSSYGIITGKPSLEYDAELPFSFKVPNRVSGVGSDNITGFCEDASGQIWVTTKFGGISIYDRRNQMFPHFSFPVTADKDVDYNHIISALEDRKGYFWFGTRNRGLLKYDPSKRSYEEVQVFQEESEVRRIDILFQSANGNIWLGHKKGINYLDPSTLKQGFSHLPKVFSIAEDESDNLWIGTLRGVFFQKAGEREFSRFRSKNPFFRNSGIEIDNIHCDSGGAIWFGTNNHGVFRYFPKADSLKQFRYRTSTPNGISGNTIRAIVEDSDGNVWIGTKSSGLNLYQGAGKFIHFGKSDGLPSNSIFSIVEDEKGFLWLTTNNGIARFEKDNGTFVNYNSNHGLQGNIFEKRASFRSRDGQLLFAGNNGFNLFDPDEISLESFTPPLVITSVRADNRLLGKDIFNKEIFSVAYDQNMVSFEFSSLDYRDRGAIRYAYKLEGVDDSWVYSENQNAVTYSNLSPGEYNFRVKATNADGIWSGDELETTIVVLKPFWLEWWAYLFYILLFSLMLLMIYWIATVRASYFHQLQTKELELQRARDLHQLKLNFFTNISHELRTPLTLIMASIEKLMKGNHSENTGKSVKAAYRSAKQLLNLTDQLLYFRRIEQGNLPLKVSKGNLIRYVIDLVLPFDELASKEGIKLKFSYNEDWRETWFDTDKIEKIIGNLVLNAFKYTPKGGSIILSFSHNDFSGELPCDYFVKGIDYARISVWDDGCGMTEDQLNHIFDRYYQTDIINTGGGIGLELVKSLVKLHKGHIQVKSQYGKGSEFIVFLPISRNAFMGDELKGNSREKPYLLSELLVDTPVASDKPVQLLENNPPQESGKARLSKLLVVEDNHELAEFMYESLHQQFFIAVAKNGKNALSKVEQFRPDIILSDIMMPGMDGLEFCRKLKQNRRTNHIPIVLITARGMEEHQKEGFEAGADAYIIKPFNIDVLILRLKTILKNRKTLLSRIREGYAGDAKKVTESSTSDEQFLNKINGIILQNFSNADFSVEEFAYDLHMSRSQLFRKIKALTDQTPSEYLYAFRIDKAVTLLGEGELTIAEIAYQTGFKSPNSFTKTFTKHAGVPPSRYEAEVNAAQFWEKK